LTREKGLGIGKRKRRRECVGSEESSLNPKKEEKRQNYAEKKLFQEMPLDWMLKTESLKSSYEKED